MKKKVFQMNKELYKENVMDVKIPVFNGCKISARQRINN